VQVRLREADDQLRSERETARTRTAELAGMLEERDAARAQLSALHEDLVQARATIAAIESTVSAKDEELRSAAERIATLQADVAERARERDDVARRAADAGARAAELEQTMDERNQILASAQDEATKAQVWLRRALEESAEYKASLAAAEARVSELEGAVATSRAELERRGTTAVDQTAPAEGPSSARELASVLQVTEEAVVRIMESTRARADRELRNVDRDRERIGREVDAMMAWRDRAAPMITSLQSEMNAVTRQVSEIGVRVNEVLRPFTGAVTRMSEQLASLDGLGRTLPPPPEDAADPSPGARIIELRDDRPAARDRRGDG
jgi:chromosome segregation protein